ncbi:hypothetical protein NQ317_007942 [Molorchus minor]|uniref:Nuclease HARBI1 n=1 Tax=Molorchus minor TaxID=1323400 RepID=A0ABQ9IQ94_9CUCU|nr:hypothetical protein NQ317_007942 [Molorchus minor]
MPGLDWSLLNMDLRNVVHDDNDLDEINLIIYGIPRRIYERAEYFHSFDNLTFYQRFRITKATALVMLDITEAQIEHPYDLNHSVAPINQLLIFLRFCATGTHLSCIGDFGGVHFSTVSRIIVRVGRVLATLYNRYIKMPRTQDEINNNHFAFYEKARFPRVIGSIDCTHIKIQSPGGEDAEIFRNRKG